MMSFNLSAQLNDNAENIRKNAPAIYEGIKCMAMSDYPNDNTMIVLVINVQSNACKELAAIKPSATLNAIGDHWYEKKCDSFNFTMILFEYKEQLKNSYY